MKNEINIDQSESYFYPIMIEEEMPIVLSSKLNKK